MIMATVVKDELEDLHHRLDVAVIWLTENEKRLVEAGWLTQGEFGELWDCLNGAVILLETAINRD